jgi:hypothetical protein
MLIAKPKGIFRLSFEIFDHTGQKAGLVEFSTFGESGTISTQVKTYSVYRESTFGDFLCVSGNLAFARASKMSFFSNSFSVSNENHVFNLESNGMFSSDFSLKLGNEAIGSIRRPSFFSRESEIDISQDLSFEVQMFVFWLVLLNWKRASSHVAAT